VDALRGRQQRCGGFRAIDFKQDAAEAHSRGVMRYGRPTMKCDPVMVVDVPIDRGGGEPEVSFGAVCFNDAYFGQSALRWRVKRPMPYRIGAEAAWIAGADKRDSTEEVDHDRRRDAAHGR